MAIWKTKRYGAACLFGLPLLIHLGLSALRLYPFDTRLILYAAPGVAIVIALGLEELLRLLKAGTRVSRVAGYGLSAVVVIMFWRQGFPIELEEIKESVDYISRQSMEKDQILSLLWRCSGLFVLPGHWLFAALAAGYSRGKAPRRPGQIHGGVILAQWQNMGP